MKKFEFDGYEAYTTDGYRHDHTAYFAHKSDAEKAAGKSGYAGVTTKKMTIVVYDTYQEYLDATAIAERNVALAKLTPKERQLLGLE